MKLTYQIEGEKVIIKDGNVFCNNLPLKEMVEEVISLESSQPQDGYYPQLTKYFNDLELIKTECEHKNRVY